MSYRFLRLRCPSRTPETQRFPRQEKAMLHCDLRVRWKVASDLRFRVAMSEPKARSFCRISGDLAPSTRESLVIAMCDFGALRAPPTYTENPHSPTSLTAHKTLTLRALRLLTQRLRWPDSRESIRKAIRANHIRVPDSAIIFVSLTLQSLLFSLSLLFSFSDFPCFFVRFSFVFQGF